MSHQSTQMRKTWRIIKNQNDLLNHPNSWSPRLRSEIVKPPAKVPIWISPVHRSYDVPSIVRPTLNTFTNALLHQSQTPVSESPCALLTVVHRLPEQTKSLSVHVLFLSVFDASCVQTPPVSLFLSHLNNAELKHSVVYFIASVLHYKWSAV